VSQQDFQGFVCAFVPRRSTWEIYGWVAGSIVRCQSLIYLKGIGPRRTFNERMDRHTLYYRLSLVWLAIMVACLVLVLMQ